MEKEIKVFVLEDDELVLDILCNFIEQYMVDHGLSYTIETSTNPLEGLLELSVRGQAYDLIIMDNKMPYMSGGEVYHSLLPSGQGFLKKILFVTGHVDNLLQRLPKVSLNILSKPFAYKAFAKKAEEILVLRYLKFNPRLEA